MRESRILHGGLALCVGLACLALASAASATAPAAPVIFEPVRDGAVVNPADVHMEAYGFSDADGHTHAYTDWQILVAATGKPAWQSFGTTGADSGHIHFGDGKFVGAYKGRFALEYSTRYVLRVRFRDSAGEPSAWSSRAFVTDKPDPPGGPVAWTARQPGFVVDRFAGGLRLPVDIAFVPLPGPNPKDPLLYVTELYGQIKVVTRDGTVRTYASGLLNFNPTGNFPGSGVLGVTGVAVEPFTGDLFVARVFDDQTAAHNHFPQVIRFHSDDGGLTAAGPPTNVLAMYGDPTGPSHQISDVTIGPDGRLYVHNGDGGVIFELPEFDSYLGKIQRLNQDGSPPTDNPFYEGSEITPTDYVWASGFRNPFGGAWRASNGAHYEVENGPSVDRLARVSAGQDFGWDGTDTSMSIGALYNWRPAHAPVSIAFVEPQTFGGSGFPPGKMDHAFVTESGPTYARGPTTNGKRVVEFWPQAGGEIGGRPYPLVEYTGTGRGTAVGLAAGPGGLFFTDLYKDLEAESPIDRGAQLWRIRYAGMSPLCTVLGTRLTVRIARGRRARIRRLRGGTIVVNGRRCGATVRNMEWVRVIGARGNERLTIDLRGGRFGPGPTHERRGASEVEIRAYMGRGRKDAVVVLGSRRRVRIPPGGRGARLNGDRDLDVLTKGVELLRARPPARGRARRR